MMATIVKLVSLLLWTLLFQEPCLGAFTTTDANNIHSAIFGASYNYLVRPSELVNVYMEFVIFSINAVDMKNQILSLSGWLTIKWQDDRLIWTPGSHGNIDIVYTTSSKIWKPEVIVDNSVSGMEVIGQDNMLYRVKNTGEVRWDPPGLYDVHCEMDVTYFPFDYQTCSLQVTSWVYDTDKVNFTKSTDYVNTEDYNENGEWQLISTSVSESTRTEEGETFSTLNFVVTLKRRSGYYLSQIIFPVLVVSFLTNITFLLPTDSGEKISFILTVLLSLAVLLTLVGDSMPTTSRHTSILAVYLSLVLALSGIVILITVLNLRLYLRVNQKDVPKWLQKLTKYILLPCFCKSSKTEIRPFSREISNADKGVDLEGTKVDSAQLKNKTLRRRSHKKEEFEEDPLTFDRDPDFPYLCRDVSGLLDWFFFHFFNVFNVVLTIIFMALLASGSQPKQFS
uniref:Acetylcholine receptor subunit alpha-type acr-16-like n=1 Tax=Crassostrea virginica TaxID=6565 RepID=A0A8B8D1F7_CRAVI|nr:acetylcholine receptor subunit alpha-type acr-16-like [Crassostrea virginica]